MPSHPTRFLIGTLLGASTLCAMIPPDREMIEQYRKAGTLQRQIEFAKALGTHRGNPDLLKRAQYKLKKSAMAKGLMEQGILAEPPPAWKDMPTKGNVKVLTILIDFNDYPHVDALNSRAQVEDRIFGDGDDQVPLPYESFREFYLRSSYNQLNFTGSVLGWFRPGYDRSAMAETTAGREQLIKEALTYFDTQNGGHDFSQYDNNGDGKVDFFSVIWSGPHGDWSTFWWGYQTSFTDSGFNLDGKTFGKYSWQWESRNRHAGAPDTWDGPFSPKTLIHEQGHGLGLPDYYDYDDSVGPRGGIGGLDMMDWVGDHNCFSKWLLDWITPEVVDTATFTGTKTLRDQATNKDALILMPSASGNPFGEFFMVQNRQQTGNDVARPIAGDGLLVWHVDSRLDSNNFDYQFDNSFTEHKLLRLMEADGLEQIETDAADADEGDFYAAGKEIGTTTTPNTSRYDGTWTNFGIRNLSASGATMNLDVYAVPADTTAPEGQPSKPSGVVDVDAVTFSWTQGTAVDPDGQIVGYYLQVGSTPGGSDVFDGKVGNVLAKTVEDLGLWDGRPIYARVKALNTAGLGSAWSEASDGSTVILPVFANCADVDNCDLTFKVVGEWGQATDYYMQGATSAYGHCIDNEQTTLQTRVTGPGTATFWWKASTEKDFDFYSVMVDGVVKNRISGDVDWNEQTIAIPAGSHVISWRWAKDSNTTGTLDRVWLDGVRYVQDLMITQQPANLTVNVNTNATFSVTVSGGVAPYHYQWYKGSAAISGATGASYTFVATAADDGKAFHVVVTDSAATPATVTSLDAILTVNGGMHEYTETEPNNTRAQANAIPKAGFVTGRVGDRRDVDVFKVVLKKNQRLNAAMTSLLGSKFRTLRLDCVDERGHIVAYGHGLNPKKLHVKARRNNEVFYVRVYYGWMHENGNYRLELNF